jgi:tRNA-dihydrouridine synthase B
MTCIYPDGAALLAPIAGLSDLPMRMACRKFGCKYAFTEMIDAGSLVFGNPKTMYLAKRGEQEDFLGVQLVGSDPETLKKAVEIVNHLHFDVLDFNLGCPAPKVAKKDEGIAFALRRPDEAVKAVELLVKHAKIPVTVKTRIHSETDPELTVAFCKRLEETGIHALTLHGRIMKTFYSGPVFYDVIRAVRETLHIPVIANGGGLTPETCTPLLTETGCTRLMIARGALGNPWIFRELAGGDPPTLKEFAVQLESHIRDMIDYYGYDLGFRVARKTVLEYLRGRGFPAPLRASVSTLAGWNTFETFMIGVRQGPTDRYWEFLEKYPEQLEPKLKA